MKYGYNKTTKEWEDIENKIEVILNIFLPLFDKGLQLNEIYKITGHAYAKIHSILG